MRVVVTGATSMIGVALIKECIKNKCHVLAIVRNNTLRMNRLPQSEYVDIVFADLNELSKLEIQGYYDVLYHLGWAYTDKGSRDNMCLQNENATYSLEAVRLAKRLGCHTFVGAGSQAEYGNVQGIINELTIEKPETAYGIAKYSAYLMCKHLCGQLDIKFIWGRIFSVYGINDNEGTLIKYAIERFRNHERANFSLATNVWNYLYEEDAGKLFYLISNTNVKEGLYCVAGKDNCSLHEYIRAIAICFKSEQNYSLDAKIPLGNSINVTAEKLYCATGYKPQIKFEEGIERIKEYFDEKD